MNSREMGNTARPLFDREEVEGVLRGSFYKADDGQPQKRPTAASHEKPTHYKVICISMYIDALERLDAMVKELKARGYTKANRSALIRHALDTVNLDEVPRGM
ncbi:MAG: hypothetical protein AAGA56_03075 [Myxococcota bacterium]